MLPQIKEKGEISRQGNGQGLKFLKCLYLGRKREVRYIQPTEKEQVERQINGAYWKPEEHSIKEFNSAICPRDIKENKNCGKGNQTWQDDNQGPSKV